MSDITRSATIMKSRDGATGAAIHFCLHSSTHLEADDFGDPVATVLVRPSDHPPQRPCRASGRNQERAMAALTEWARTNEGDCIPSLTVEDLLRGQGLKDRRRRREQVEFLIRSGVIVPATGGFNLNRSAL